MPTQATNGLTLNLSGSGTVTSNADGATGSIIWENLGGVQSISFIQKRTVLNLGVTYTNIMFDIVSDNDNDGVPNRFDLDSDNDGIPDSIESVPQGMATRDDDANGVIDANEAGGYGANGLANSVETTPESGIVDYDNDGEGDPPVDSDGDGAGDWIDRDSDEDGLDDVEEAGFGAGDADKNGQLVVCQE